MNLAIVTPSRIGSKKRLEFASKSYQSLNRAVGGDYLHYVADDVPTFLGGIPDPRFSGKAPEVYAGSHVRLSREYGEGSVPAFRRALAQARVDGANLAFVHLDDNVYLPCLRELMAHAIEAFKNVPDLQLIRLGGYPLLHDDSDPVRGNLTHLDVSPDAVVVGGLIFEPARFDDFTLWSAPFTPAMARSDVWCLVQWLVIYRIGFLQTVVETSQSAGPRHLSHVEKYFRDPGNWERFIRDHPGRMGYINWQFGGHEMERSAEWETLLRYPNTPLR